MCVVKKSYGCCNLQQMPCGQLNKTTELGTRGGFVRLWTCAEWYTFHKRWYNFISLSTLGSQGYMYTSEDGVLNVLKGSTIVTKGDLQSCNLNHLRGLQLLAMLL